MAELIYSALNVATHNDIVVLGIGLLLVATREAFRKVS